MHRFWMMAAGADPIQVTSQALNLPQNVSAETRPGMTRGQSLECLCEITATGCLTRNLCSN